MYETLPPSLCFPSTIDQYRAKNEVLEKEIPQLQEIAGKVWKKEDELKQLKSELAALDRKIAAELAPKHDEKDGEEVKPDTQQQQPDKVVEINPSPQSQSADDKKSMVAEPIGIYRPPVTQSKSSYRSFGS